MRWLTSPCRSSTAWTVLQAGTLTACGNRSSRRSRILRAPQVGGCDDRRLNLASSEANVVPMSPVHSVTYVSSRTQIGRRLDFSENMTFGLECGDFCGDAIRQILVVLQTLQGTSRLAPISPGIRTSGK